MVRVKQFADDLAISKKQAKDLINKGRNRKDGGSQILESVMSDTDKKKKKKADGRRAPVVKKSKTDDFQTADYRKEFETDRSYSKGGSNVTTMNTDKLTKAQMGQFKNIQNDAVSGKISPEEAQRKIRKMLLIKRKDGGGFPDLTGDGKVTKKDILKGRGVPGFSRGGEMQASPKEKEHGTAKGMGTGLSRKSQTARGGGIAIQGLGFKGVR